MFLEYIFVKKHVQFLRPPVFWGDVSWDKCDGISVLETKEVVQGPQGLFDSSTLTGCVMLVFSFIMFIPFLIMLVKFVRRPFLLLSFTLAPDL